ncbi:hypothetical protein B1A87_000945 [Arthrobacter sp. KBS0703]|uniref:hypothetical protein n=1 Tax=Arthrobacter sp. KBS0703 TaxID=1955698 RepID=UPI0011160E2C|nr:hypothetical protein [Arthrobacter sp. KBS0703]TSE14714.1 hypothetical protein B1A87_000945 [Arthrobacter sp. KBS0703]
MPLVMAAGLSVGLLGLVVLFTMNSQARFLLLFFVNACLLVVKPRFFGEIDLAVVGSLVAVLAAALAVKFNGSSQVQTTDYFRTRAKLSTSQFALIGFAGLAFISTLANAQPLMVLLPWLNGAILTLFVSRTAPSGLPSFTLVRRTVLVAGLVTVAYDLLLLGSGKAMNVGPFNAGRFLGSVGDYELLAEYYGALILIAITAAFFDPSRRWQMLAGILLVPSSLVLIATESRGPIVILCVITPLLVGMSALLFRESAGRIFRISVAAAVAIAASIGALAATPLFERLMSTQLGGSVDSTLNRAGVWDYFTQLPEFVRLGPAGNGFEYPYESIGTYPHSLYLWLLWSGGWVGLAFFVVFVCLELGKLTRGVVTRSSASLSAAAVLAFVLTDEIKIEAARNSATVSFLWFVIAMAVLARREQRES